MEFVLLIFLSGALLMSWIDWKWQMLPDKISLPYIFALVAVKYFSGTLSIQDSIAAILVVVIFVIFIVLNMELGGGDIRFGIFSALFVGLENIGYFLAIAGVSHILLLYGMKKYSFGFVPAMSLSALIAWSIP